MIYYIEQYQAQKSTKKNNILNLIKTPTGSNAVRTHAADSFVTAPVHAFAGPLQPRRTGGESRWRAIGHLVFVAVHFWNLLSQIWKWQKRSQKRVNQPTFRQTLSYHFRIWWIIMIYVWLISQDNLIMFMFSCCLFAWSAVWGGVPLSEIWSFAKAADFCGEQLCWASATTRAVAEGTAKLETTAGRSEISSVLKPCLRPEALGGAQVFSRKFEIRL